MISVPEPKTGDIRKPNVRKIAPIKKPVSQEDTRPRVPSYASTTNSEQIQHLQNGDKKMCVREDARFLDIPLLPLSPRSALDNQQSYVCILDVLEQSSAPLKEQTAVRFYCAERLLIVKSMLFKGGVEDKLSGKLDDPNDEITYNSFMTKKRKVVKIL
jgi:hypothetical protein